MSVIVKIISKDFTKPGFDKASARTKKLEAEVSKATAKLKLMGIAAAAGAVIAINKYAGFDRKIREITTLLGDVTEKDVKKLGTEVEDMSIKYGQAMDRMAKARYDIISAGFNDAAKSAIVLGQSAKLAVAGVSDVGSTAHTLVSILNAYSMSAKDAQKVSDILFTTVRLGVTTMSELSMAMGRATAIAPTLGIRLDEIAAMLATLTAGGQSTDEAITAIVGTMTQLLSPSKALAERIHQLHFESAKAMLQTLGLNGALKKITEGATEADKSAYFPNMRAMRGVFPVVSTLANKFQQNLKEMGNTSGVVDKAFKKMKDGIAFRMARMKEIFAKLEISVGDALAPIAEGLASVAERFNKLEPAAQRAVLAFNAVIGAAFLLRGAIAAALGPVGFLYSALAAIGVGLAVWAIPKAIQGITGESDKFEEAARRAEAFKKQIKGIHSEMDAINVIADETKNNLATMAPSSTAVNLKINWEKAPKPHTLGEFVPGLEENPTVDVAIKPVIKDNDMRSYRALLYKETLETAKNLPHVHFHILTDEDVGNDKALIEQDVNDTVATIEAGQQQRMMIAQQVYSGSLELQKAFFEQKLAAIDKNWRQNAELAQYWADFIAKIEQQKRVQSMENATKYMNALANVFMQFYNMQRANIESNLQRDIKAQQQSYNATVKAIKAKYTVGGKLTEEGNKKLAEAETKYHNTVSMLRDKAQQQEIAAARAMKPVKIAQAISNTALAVTKALPNIILAGLVAAAGAVEVGVIAAQPYASGGEVQPIDFKPVGTDVVPAMLTPGEVIIPAAQARMNQSQIQQILYGGPTSNQSTTITVSPQLNITAVDAQGVSDLVASDDFKESFTNVINDSIIKLTVNGQPVEAET